MRKQAHMWPHESKAKITHLLSTYCDFKYFWVHKYCLLLEKSEIHEKAIRNEAKDWLYLLNSNFLYNELEVNINKCWLYEIRKMKIWCWKNIMIDLNSLAENTHFTIQFLCTLLLSNTETFLKISLMADVQIP